VSTNQLENGQHPAQLRLIKEELLAHNLSKNIDDVINSADKYLYQAKDAGRNQIFPKHK